MEEDPNGQGEGEEGKGLYLFKPFSISPCKWKEEGEAPMGRSGHSMVADLSGNLYVYGGFNPSLVQNGVFEDPALLWMEEPLFKEIWKFNMATNRWSRLSVENVPIELVSNGVVLKNKSIVVIGGTGFPFGETCGNSVNVCDLREEQCTFRRLEARGTPPAPQYGQGVLLDGGYLYVVGGTTGYDYNLDVHRFSFKTSLWEEFFLSTGRNGEPTGRYRHGLAFDGLHIFILGGGSENTTEGGFEDIPALNIRTKKWTTIRTIADKRFGFPAPRKHHSSVQFGLQVTIVGGFDGVNTFKDSWLLDLNRLQWTKLCMLDLPSGRYFNAAAVTPSGKMFTFGGVIHHNDVQKRTSEMFSAWMCIPSLKEMAWDAVIHYEFPRKFKKTSLATLGVPSEFLDQIC